MGQQQLQASRSSGACSYKLVDSKWDVDVIIDQIEKTRRTDGVAVCAFFRAEHLLGNNPKIKRLYDALRKDVFNRPLICRSLEAIRLRRHAMSRPNIPMAVM